MVGEKTSIIISRFAYLPSAEKESGFRIAITGFGQGKDIKTHLTANDVKRGARR